MQNSFHERNANVSYILNKVFSNSFIKNRGQYSPKVKYAFNFNNISYYFTVDRINVKLLSNCNASNINNVHSKYNGRFLFNQQNQENKKKYVYENKLNIKMYQFSILFIDINYDAKIVGADINQNKTNYFISNKSTKWKMNVPSYKNIRYNNLYDGIDVIYYARANKLKYDIVVKPFTDIRKFRYKFENINSDSLKLDSKGNLQYHNNDFIFMEEAPYAYQMIDGDTVRCEARFILHDNEISYEVIRRKNNLQLIIDPGYSTYFGGNSDWDGCQGSCVDTKGNIYITGYTNSTDLPTTQDALTKTNNGNIDIFVAKFDSTLSQLLYCTYLGGSYGDWCFAFDADKHGNLYLAGNTESRDFPVSNDAFQKKLRGDYDGFIVKLDSTGSKLIYSTYLGGSTFDEIYDIKADSIGNAYITGLTDSENFPTTTSAFQRSFQGGNDDAFVSKLNSDGTRLLFSTYFGGEYSDEGNAISVDKSGCVYFGGLSDSEVLPITNDAFQNKWNGFNDGFLAKLDSSGSYILYCTYLGGHYDDQIDVIKIDLDGSIVVGGVTASEDFPTTSYSFQPNKYKGDIATQHDIFISKFNYDMSKMVFSTYLGGEYYDYVHDILISNSGDICLCGGSASSNYPVTTNAYQKNSGGNWDGIITQLSKDGHSLIYSTYLGGSELDGCVSIRLYNNKIYVSGRTESTNFPITPNVYQRSLKDSGDAFITIFAPDWQLSAIKTETLNIPKKSIYLSQSYPNPFPSSINLHYNSTTTIEYYISTKTSVKLIVYDASGKEIAVLVDEYKEPGLYKATFNGENHPSGVYYYRLVSGNTTLTRKMSLIK